jgi:putative peptidoglycan lipid II flippase
VSKAAGRRFASPPYAQYNLAASRQAARLLLFLEDELMTIKPTVSESVPSASLEPSTNPDSASLETARIARTASILSLGNVISRVLGLVRQYVKSHYFGAGGAVDAFNVATIVPTMLYDLLIGGMVDSSLVPVFSEYVETRRDELWGLASVVISLTVVILTGFVILVEFFAEQVAFLLNSGASPAGLALTASLLRITVPAVFFLSLSGIFSALLYALKRFTFPAFTAATFNAGIVAVTLIFHKQLDITSMALGLLIGSILQVVLQAPGLLDGRFRFRIDLSHPGLRRIVTLFTPVILGLLVEILISRPISYTLASQTGEGGISWMDYATNIRQLPQGLVATAISFAILPTLSAHAANEGGSDPERFVATLARGMRLVMVLIIPATIGLYILAQPTIALLFEHGDFYAYDTLQTTRALQYYLLVLFAFYARQDTLTPALIGVGSTVIYLGLAIALLPTMGLFSLMIADSAKQLLHMVISWIIMRQRLGGMNQHGINRTLGLSLIATAMMGLAAYLTLVGVETLFPSGGAAAEILSVGIPGLVGAGIYLALLMVFRVEEIQLMWTAIQKRLAIK